MNDIRPPRPRREQPSTPPAVSSLPNQSPAPAAPQSTSYSEPVATAPAEPATSLPPEKPKKRRGKKKIISVLLAATTLVCVMAGVAAFTWYHQELRAPSGDASSQIKVTIPPGANVSQIAGILEKEQLIRNKTVFEMYAKLHRKSNLLQAGTYRLSRANDVPAIVSHLTSGKTDTFTVTFLPGGTLADHRKQLIKAGFSAASVDAALKKNYSLPLLADKPATADLEGYVYGETYQFPTDATPEQIVERALAQMQKTVKAQDLEAKFKAKGLSLYQGITLASIVQREVGDNLTDQKMVAGIFMNRLKQGMNLGSDVTYQYIADKTGVARDPGLDSPYNTRIHAGLPPGPIASPGKNALVAVGSPTASDYLFFLSGDDDKTYYGKTQAEHEQNITKHCQKKCQIL